MNRYDTAVILGFGLLATSVSVAIAGIVLLDARYLIGGTTFAIVFAFVFITILSVICDKKT